MQGRFSLCHTTELLQPSLPPLSHPAVQVSLNTQIKSCTVGFKLFSVSYGPWDGPDSLIGPVITSPPSSPPLFPSTLYSTPLNSPWLPEEVGFLAPLGPCVCLQPSPALSLFAGLILFFFFFFFPLAMPCVMQDLSSPTRYQTHVPCVESAES